MVKHLLIQRNRGVDFTARPSFGIPSMLLGCLLIFIWYSWDRSQRSDPSELSVKVNHGVCSLHAVKTIPIVVPVGYGLPSLQFLAMGQSRFPNAWHSAVGGCVITADSPNAALVRYCPECRYQEKQWLQEYAAGLTAPGRTGYRWRHAAGSLPIDFSDAVGFQGSSNTQVQAHPHAKVGGPGSVTAMESVANSIPDPPVLESSSELVSAEFTVSCDFDSVVACGGDWWGHRELLRDTECEFQGERTRGRYLFHRFLKLINLRE